MPDPYKSNYGIVTVTASALTITPDAHAGFTIVSDLAATQTFTLPPATGSGNTYEIVVKTTKTGNLDIVVDSAAATMIGQAFLQADSGDTVVAFAAGGTADTIRLDGSTQGGIAGAYVKLTDIAANLWHAMVYSDASGTEATPFEATVS